MNLLSYPVFLILNSITALGLIGVAAANGFDNGASIFLIIAGLIQLIVIALSQNKKLVDFANLIDVRLTGLVLFVIALIVTFSPYLLGFVDNSLLVGTTTAVAAITLISFVFADLTLPDTDTNE